MRRLIVEIDERLCTGCGLCMLDCPACAIEVCDGCSRLADDRCCDGGGACIPACPHGAISLAEREARPFDRAVLAESVVSRGEVALRCYLENLRARDEAEELRLVIEYLNERRIPVPPRSDDAGQG